MLVRAISTVFAINIAMVNGPTPPGTGVYAAGKRLGIAGIDVTRQFAIGTAIHADIHNGRAGLNEVASN